MNPDDQPSDDPLLEALEAYDDAMPGSTVRPVDPDAHASPPDRSIPDSPPRIERLQELLWRLEADRRRQENPISSATTSEAPTAHVNALPESSRKLGRFEIVRELGHGGWGIVFLAWDPRLRRQVALKVPRPEALLAQEHRRRFLREAQTMAGLDHPGIVPLYEAGEIGPIWYLVSAYCKGDTLANWLGQHLEPVGVRDVAELLVRLAEVVEYTHTHGIVHRDLKPSNILLPIADDPNVRPIDALASPKITDFGLAKLLQRDGDETRSGLLLGTPTYMAPEQASGQLREIGPPTDVYSLGVILYELLVGRVPFRGESDLDTLTQIREGEPILPSRLRKGLPRDLEAICLKCLEKLPARRYARAGDLAADLRRFLTGKPTLARPLSSRQRTVRWCRRRPALTALAAVAVLALLGVSSLGLWHVNEVSRHNVSLQVALDEANKQRNLAEERERKVNREAYAALMARASRFHDRGETGMLSEVLNMLRPDPRDARAEDLRDFAWHYLWSQVHSERFLRGHRNFANAVSFSRDGRFCASGGNDHAIILWDVATGKALATLMGHGTCVTSVAFSTDGSQLVSAGCHDQLGENGAVKLWDVASGKLMADLTGPLTYAHAAAFTADGQSIVIAGSVDEDRQGVVLIHDLKSGHQRELIKCARRATSLALSADGRYLAAGSGRPSDDLGSTDDDGYDLIHVWDFVAGEKRVLSSADRQVVKCLAFAPVGHELLSGGFDGTIRAWDVATGSVTLVGEAPKANERIWVDALAFSSTGQTLFSSRFDLESRTSVLYQWDMARRLPRSRSVELDYQAAALAVAPDDQTLALACGDHLVRLRSLGEARNYTDLRGHDGEVWGVAFSSDGKTLASSSDDHTIKLWDLTTGQEQKTLTGHRSLVSALEFSCDGRWLTSASYDHQVKVWDAQTGAELATLAAHTHPIRCLALSPDSLSLASADKSGRVEVWDLATQSKRFSLDGHRDGVRCLVVADQGATLISGSNDSTIRFWDMKNGELRRELCEASEVWSLAVSQDGKLLASGHKDRLIRLWELPTGKPVNVLGGHTGGIRSLAFGPDGRTLASGGEDRSISFWQPATGHELISFKDLPSEVNCIKFSADGQTLAAALQNGDLRYWLAPTVQVTPRSRLPRD